MSEAADESQKAKKQCVVFEPQAWRKTLCRNCFKTKNDHAAPAPSDTDDQQKPTLPSDNGDYIVIARREGTPLKDRSRSSTPVANTTPATTPTATPVGKNILTSEQDTSTLVGKENNRKTNKDASVDKEKDKTINKTRFDVDKSGQHLSKASVVAPAKKSETGVGECELQEQDQPPSVQVNHKKYDDEKTSIVNSEQPAVAQQSTVAPQNNEADNIHGHTCVSEAPTISAAQQVAVGKAANSSSAVNKEGAATSVNAAVQPHSGVESSRSESSHHGNASSPHVMLTNVEQVDIQKMDDTSGITRNTHGSVISEDGSSSIAARKDDAVASAVAVAAGVGISRSSDTSDEIIGDVARSAEVSQADCTKIDPRSGERSVAAAGSMVGQDVVDEVPGAGCKVNAGLSEDAQPVRQLDPTPDQPVDVCATDIPGVQSGLFTNSNVANSVGSASNAGFASSICHATAVDELDVGSGEQQSPQGRVDIGVATGNDSAPEVTSRDSADGHAKVEATITLSGLSSSYIDDNSRPIHIVSATGISGYQRGDGNSDFAVDAERSRLPPDYEQSAGYASSSTSGDDAYGPTSPLVEYLSRSPFARSLHGATERSPETEIVATGGGGETSLFHHVPAASDSEKADTAAEWEAEQSRNGCVAADSDTDTRLNS